MPPGPTPWKEKGASSLSSPRPSCTAHPSRPSYWATTESTPTEPNEALPATPSSRHWACAGRTTEPAPKAATAPPRVDLTPKEVKEVPWGTRPRHPSPLPPLLSPTAIAPAFLPMLPSRFTEGETHLGARKNRGSAQLAPAPPPASTSGSPLLPVRESREQVRTWQPCPSPEPATLRSPPPTQGPRVSDDPEV